jgi:hypothetical protein
MKTQTQKEMIFNYLKTGGAITQIEALKWFGCFRLADVIYKIEKQTGLIVDRRLIGRRSVYGVKYFSQYWIKNLKLK